MKYVSQLFIEGYSKELTKKFIRQGRKLTKKASDALSKEKTKAEKSRDSLKKDLEKYGSKADKEILPKKVIKRMKKKTDVVNKRTDRLSKINRQNEIRIAATRRITQNLSKK